MAFASCQLSPFVDGDDIDLAMRGKDLAGGIAKKKRGIKFRRGGNQIDAEVHEFLGKLLTHYHFEIDPKLRPLVKTRVDIPLATLRKQIANAALLLEAYFSANKQS